MDRMISRPHTKMHVMMETICNKCGMPDAVYRRSVSLNGEVVSRDLHRGWNLGARAAATVTLACRLEGVPRTAKAICEAAGVKPGQAHHVYSFIVEEMDVKVPPPDPAAFIGSIAAACGVPEAVRRRAVELLRKAVPELTGKDPMTLAAAVLYMVCAESDCGVSQQEIADAARVSTVSLRQRRKDLARVITG